MSSQAVPTTPDAWKLYSQANSLPKLPQREKLSNTGDDYLHRDIYIDTTTAFQSNASLVNIYADVFGFQSPNTTIDIPQAGIIQIICRVVTATAPLILTLNPISNELAVFIIYASALDQPISYICGSNSPMLLDLSTISGNLGAQISFENGAATLSYFNKYVDLSMSDDEFSKSLVTQLRIASLLFWIQPAIAISLTSHVARATAESRAGALLNLQAHALGQQISASALTGPNLNYAPVLALVEYKTVLDGAIAATSAFETQYNRFADRQASIEDQRLAWKSMLDQANDGVNLQQTLVDNAFTRWNNATSILNTAEDTMRGHQLVLKDKEAEFNLGIETWKRQQIIKTIGEVLQAIVGFAIAIGAIAIGDPASAASAPAVAAGAAQTIAAAANAEHAFLNPGTIKSLTSGIEAVAKLWEATQKTVGDIHAQSGISPSSVNLSPVGGDVSGDDQSSADLNAIVSLAAWDAWTLEVDEQLSFAVEQSIGGAKEYRLELRKHVLDGKLLTQARAQAVKIGQEYAQLWLQLHATQLNAARLQQLLDTYQGEEDTSAEAQSYFHDRMSMLQASIMVYMRDAIWAYKYYTLSHSSIVLDPLKTTLDYQQDSQSIFQEVTQCKSQYSSDFTPFSLSARTIDMPLDYPTSIVASLKSTGSATITLAPTITSTGLSADSLPPISGPFTEGSRFRVFGMRAFLLGAKPKSFEADNKAMIQLKIKTSGIYQDVQNNQVYGFTMTPLDRLFGYRVARDGTEDPTPAMDSIIKSQDYVDPTAFAQWTVTIKDPENIDLTGLTGLRLYWEGNARFD